MFVCFVSKNRAKEHGTSGTRQMVQETGGAFHLVENSENSGLGVNGKRFFGSPDWKISGKSGTAQKVVPFSRLERPDWFLAFQLHFPVIFTSSRPTAAKFSPPFCNKMASTPSEVMMYQCSCCLLATHSMEHLLKHDCTYYNSGR